MKYGAVSAANCLCHGWQGLSWLEQGNCRYHIFLTCSFFSFWDYLLASTTSTAAWFSRMVYLFSRCLVGASADLLKRQVLMLSHDWRAPTRAARAAQSRKYRHITGAAYFGNDIPCLTSCPADTRKFRAVGVFCGKGSSILHGALQHHDQPVAACFPGLRYHAVMPGQNLRALGHPNIHRLMVVLFSADRVDAVAIVAWT